MLPLSFRLLLYTLTVAIILLFISGVKIYASANLSRNVSIDQKLCEILLSIIRPQLSVAVERVFMLRCLWDGHRHSTHDLISQVRQLSNLNNINTKILTKVYNYCTREQNSTNYKQRAETKSGLSHRCWFHPLILKNLQCVCLAIYRYLHFEQIDRKYTFWFKVHFCTFNWDRPYWCIVLQI